MFQACERHVVSCLLQGYNWHVMLQGYTGRGMCKICDVTSQCGDSVTQDGAH